MSLLVSASEQPTQMHVITFMNVISGLPTAVQAGPFLADPWYINRMGTHTDATNHEYYSRATTKVVPLGKTVSLLVSLCASLDL